MDGTTYPEPPKTAPLMENAHQPVTQPPQQAQLPPGFPSNQPQTFEPGSQPQYQPGYQAGFPAEPAPQPDFQNQFPGSPAFPQSPSYDPHYNGGYDPNVKQELVSDIDTPLTSDGLDRKLSSDSRMGFIRKVYGIVFCQLTVTALWIAIVSCNQQFFYNFLRSRYELLFLSVTGFLVTLYALACYQELARRVPLNYYLLAVFTICFSYVASFTTVFYDPQTVMIAGATTAAMVGGLTLYAVTTKTDYSVMFAFLWSLAITLFVATIFALFMRNQALKIFVTVLAIMILSIYIIYDTQLIFGQRSIELSIDDYVFGAMILYLDIMRLFFELLKLLGKK